MCSNTRHAAPRVQETHTGGRNGDAVSHRASPHVLRTGRAGPNRRAPEDRKMLRVAGAAAGLAAIFKAPLTGLVFAPTS
jgi:H+/Cl- antiporter ClcA